MTEEDSINLKTIENSYRYAHEKGSNYIQSILRFVTPRFVNKTRFVNTFFGNENVTNRVSGGFQKTK